MKIKSKLILSIFLGITLSLILLSSNAFAATTIYGDVNGDGKITTKDADMVLEYSKNQRSFNDNQKELADVTNDRKIDKSDADYIRARAYGATSLFPVEIVYGDLDGDGKVTSADSLIIQRYFSGLQKLDSNQFKAADVDGDRKITSADWLLINRRSVNIIKFFPVENITLGDVDGDQKITSADSLKVLRAWKGLETLTNRQKKSADFNGDGKINNIDANLILNKSVGK